MEQHKEYYAFISYKREDKKGNQAVAACLQQILQVISYCEIQYIENLGDRSFYTQFGGSGVL